MQNIKRIKQDTSGVEPKALTIIRVTSSTTKIIQKLHILYGKVSTCVIIKNFYGILKISSITSHCLGNELVLPPQRNVWNNDHTQDNGVNGSFPEASDINCNFFCEQLARQFGLKFFETSAKTQKNVQEVN